MSIGLYVGSTNQYKPVQPQSNAVVQRYNTLWVYRLYRLPVPGHEPMKACDIHRPCVHGQAVNKPPNFAGLHIAPGEGAPCLL